jgi:hypothetical protein
VPDEVEIATGYDPQKDECVLENCDPGKLKNARASQVNVLFILDSSGSMAAKTADGRVKIDAAKEAVSGYIASAPENVNFGLMVYGHKGSNKEQDKPASCAGIEILYQIGKPNKDEVLAAVNKFTATGWTPIAGSFQKTEEAFLNRKEESNHVILVSDGEETCGGDPVSAAKLLKDQGIVAQIDAIGFAVDAKTKTQLEAIAAIGGGKYYEAIDASGLLEAMKTAGDNALTEGKYRACLVDIYIAGPGGRGLLNCQSSRALEFYKFVGDKQDETLGLYGHKRGEFPQKEYDLLRGAMEYYRPICQNIHNRTNEAYKKAQQEAGGKLQK